MDPPLRLWRPRLARAYIGIWGDAPVGSKELKLKSF